MIHPVRFEVEMPTGPRNRLSALLRPVLAIPHALLVGGPGMALLGGAHRVGAFGAFALLMALVDWVAIVFTEHALPGLQPLKRLYLGWRARALAYSAFLRDEYPPFGEGHYPASLELPPEPERRDRFEVLLRPLLILPHVLVLALMLIAWAVSAIISWLYLVITAGMPPVLWRFSRDVITYSLRVEAYALLLHDLYPPFPFSRESEAVPAASGVPPPAEAMP